MTKKFKDMSEGEQMKTVAAYCILIIPFAFFIIGKFSEYMDSMP